MVPDYRLQLSSQISQQETRLAELKFTCRRSYYKPGVRQRNFVRTVDKRAVKLMGEYREKADKMDRLIGEESDNGQGRVRRQLDQFGELVGLVVGQFNEISNDTHQLIDEMAKSRVEKVARLEGRQISGHEKGLVVGQIRRQLSTKCGDGAALAAKRREVNLREEEHMRREREIQWICRTRGGPIIRKGQFFRC